MRFNIFDVIELKNGKKATILDNKNNIYKVEIVNDNGVRHGIKNITEIEVKKVIYSKKY